MIATLLRQDPAARGLPILVVAGVAAGWLLRNFTLQLPADPSTLTPQARGWIGFMLCVAWCCSLFMLFSVHFMTRASRLAMALPLKGRTVWWTRMVSMLYTGVMPLAVATLVAAFHFRAGEGWFRLSPHILLLGGKACAGLVLAAFLFQSPQPRLYRVRPGVDYVIYVILVSVFVLVVVALLPTHVVSILVLLALAAVPAVRLHLAVPVAFLLLPKELDDDDPVLTELRTAQEDPPSSPTPPESKPDTVTAEQAAAAAQTEPADTGADRGPGERWLLHRTLFRVLVNHWQTWVFVPVLALYSFLLFDAYYGGKSPNPNVAFMTMWMIMLMYQALIRLHRVDHLPVARRAIFPHVVLPGLCAILLGSTAGALLYVPDEESCQVCYADKGIRVAPEFWEVAWDGRPPEITSPWGESVSPTAHRIYPGSRIAVYSPFETTDRSSDRFRALQASRAVAAVHGSSPFSDEAIAASGDENPLVEVMGRRREFEQGFPIEASVGRGSPSRLRVWLVAALGIGWAWTLAIVVWLFKFHGTVYRRLFSVLYFSAAAVWITLIVVYLLGDLLRGRFDGLVAGRLPWILLRHWVETVPVGTTGLWIALALSVPCAYLLIQAAFRGIEAPLGKLKPVWREYG